MVSGGHTQVIEVESFEAMETVMRTGDDSFGESFDKCAKMMGLGYPGGPVIESLAQRGDAMRYDFTVPLSRSPRLEFSYSGLKNAVRLAVEAGGESDYPDIAASFQRVATEHLLQKLRKYFKIHPPKRFAIVGGASANRHLRSEIEMLLRPYGTELLTAELKYCSDNAAMIGRAAVEMYAAGQFTPIEAIDVAPKSLL